ncbi:hydrolase [Gordonia paraffinivorans]|uniref:hydrolase n=1 Tax=Gordonia paraffinivorans TaxID=175628 RepID=UPI001E4F5CB1|nr:hydrolase [Gordonia paraffinivorans]MCD2145267.1 hydrolase [Gordonia paraffinivorans]
MRPWMCAFCANEFPPADSPPEICPICDDDRQWIPPDGPAWFRLDDRADNTLAATEVEPGLIRLSLEPRVGIGQQGFLVETPAGNILWEPPGFVGPALVDEIERRGGIVAVAASHPHLLGAGVSLSHRFGRVPVFYNALDRRWLTRPDLVVEFWSGETEIVDGIRVVRCGGHFPGSSVLHLPRAAGGRGAILSGDTIKGVLQPGKVTFMRSYPNMLPLSPRLVRQIVGRVSALGFDRLYDAFGVVVERDAKQVIETSARRYIGWATDEITDPDDPDAW